MALRQDAQQVVQPNDINECSSTPVHDNDNEEPLLSKSEFHAASDWPPPSPLPQVPDWRLYPGPLDGMTIEKWMGLIFDIFLTILPLLFAGLAIAVARLDGQPESNWGYQVTLASTLGPTIWPILFGAVVGSTLQHIALYHAERGTTFGFLELLTGSQTMWTTVQRAFTIRYFHCVALLLLALWSLSPVGGQASLRALTLETGVAINTAEVSYQTSNTPLLMTQTATGSGDGISTEENLIMTMYGAAQMLSDSGLQYSNGSSGEFDALLQRLGGADTVSKSSTQDIWGNIRIPVLQLLPGFDPNDTNQWVSVPHQEQIISYESLIGVPFQIPSLNGGNASFSINSTYFRFDCPSIRTVSKEDILNGNAFTGQLQVHDIAGVNTTNLGQILFDADGSGTAGFSLDTTLPFPTNLDRANEFFAPSANASTYPPRDVLIISRGNASEGGVDIAFITCYAKYHYVESLVSCSSLAISNLPSCAVDSMRDIKPPNVQETLTPIDEIAVGMNLLESFTKVCLQLHPGVSTTTEYFLVDPPTALSHTDFNPANLTLVANDVLANRFTLLFNTYWHGSINTPLIVGRPLDYSLTDPYQNPWANTTASISSFTRPSYVVKKGWLTILIIATAILFVTGLIGLVIKYCTHVPDIFGYVSSLTHDSPYLVVPGMAHEDFLTGTQRARLMKDVGVRFLRVALGRDMEKITLALFPPTSGEKMEG